MKYIVRTKLRMLAVLVTHGIAGHDLKKPAASPRAGFCFSAPPCPR